MTESQAVLWIRIKLMEGTVHRTFYTAMRASSVDVWRAKVMYAAVYHFGPRWGMLPGGLSSERISTLQLQRLVDSINFQYEAALRAMTEFDGRTHLGGPPLIDLEDVVSLEAIERYGQET